MLFLSTLPFDFNAHKFVSLYKNMHFFEGQLTRVSNCERQEFSTDKKGNTRSKKIFHFQNSVKNKTCHATRPSDFAHTKRQVKWRQRLFNVNSINCASHFPFVDWSRRGYKYNT